MQKIFFILVFACISSCAVSQNRNWDKPMQLKSCHIKIQADHFTATTFIEMEFYNPNDQEIEGLYKFQLQPGQAITHFQLDLYGKYRDGSIEEKWKAANAYNTIVGKRIDPALLQMDYYNNYSLRIYPIAGKGTRKITMTIREVLKINKESIEYNLPLNVKDHVQFFTTEIAVNNTSTIPYIKNGLFVNKIFSGSQRSQKLFVTEKNILLNKPISFHIPLIKSNIFCTEKNGSVNYFALRVAPSFQKTYSLSPNKIKIFWDVSSSGNKRDISKEINFLKQYIAYHNIQQINISTFNFKLQESMSFDVSTSNVKWMSYLNSLEYEGATKIGSIDLSRIQADAVFIFTDGNNSYGNALPKGDGHYIFTVHASSNANNESLKAIVGETGGRNIDLLKLSMHEAIQMASSAENILMDIRSASGRSIINFQHYYKEHNLLLITGTLHGSSDSLIFNYGNNNNTFRKEKVMVRIDECSTSSIHQMETLLQFDDIIKSNNWQNILFFGKEKGIVTPNTSYLVLERIEDYITYQIDPPKELEEECEARGFVRSDKRKKLQQFNLQSEQQILSNVVHHYNARIISWGDGQAISFSSPSTETKRGVDDKSFPGEPIANSSVSNGFLNNSNLDEVVVVGFSASKRSSHTGAVSVIKSNEIFSNHTSVEQVLAGRVPGLQVTSATPGSATEVRIRGLASINANNQPLYVLNGMPVSGNINDLVGMNEIDFIEVLKDVSATALYGSRGSNGVIFIKTKDGKRLNNYYQQPGTYKLKDMEDVDYLVEIKEENKDGKWAKYKELQTYHGNDAAFYLDMAQHFYTIGLKEKAILILSNAAEVSAGNLAVLKAMAFLLEQWKEFDIALEIYEQIKRSSINDLTTYRDISLIHYQKGNYHQAVDLMYAAIIKNMEAYENENLSVKAMMLNDLNAIVAMHTNDLDLSALNQNILKPLPVDLRIVIECNSPHLYNQLSIVEPGGAVAQYSGSKTKNSGYITADYNYKVKEYQIKEAVKGKYRIQTNYYDHYRSRMQIPAMVKITTYKNFGRPNQSIHVENVMMDNQNGTVEIGEVKW